MLRLCFPGVRVELDKADLVARLPGESEVWFGGLDDKDRTEKILGQEHATIFLNECSQIPFASRTLAVTRLAQKVDVRAEGRPLRLKMFYDCNPPNQAHWLYRMFMKKVDPENGGLLRDPANYAALQLNPGDNAENLPADYLNELEQLPARMRVRFLLGEFADASEGALWTLEAIERWREAETPDLQRIVVGIDPSGSGDVDNAGNDEIGIVVAGLGADGNGYVLEDLSIKAGPEKWGGIAVLTWGGLRGALSLVLALSLPLSIPNRDTIVSVTVGTVVLSLIVQGSSMPYLVRRLGIGSVKIVRAEPIAAFYEQNRVRHAGAFSRLEDQLTAFTTEGYVGDGSPDRADAMIWAMSELFPGIVKKHQEADKPKEQRRLVVAEGNPAGWMA